MIFPPKRAHAERRETLVTLELLERRVSVDLPGLRAQLELKDCQ